jgi:hypothetical protein
MAAWCGMTTSFLETQASTKHAPQTPTSNGIKCTGGLSGLHKLQQSVDPSVHFYGVLSLRQSEQLKFLSRGVGPENPIALVCFGPVFRLEANEILPLKCTELFLA